MFAVAPPAAPEARARTRPSDAPPRAPGAPVARLLNQAQVAWVLGFRSRSSLWRIRRENPHFPQPLMIAGALRWPEAEVMAWAVNQPRVAIDASKRRGNARPAAPAVPAAKRKRGAKAGPPPTITPAEVRARVARMVAEAQAGPEPGM